MDTHISKAGDLTRDHKLLCGLTFQTMPFKDDSVAFKFRHNATCQKCKDVAIRIETMLHNKR